MYENIIQLPETQYLGFGIMMPWENNLEIQFNLWEEAEASHKIDRLKKMCGSDRAVGIFCYRCDMEKHTFSYHIACENKKNAYSEEFEQLTINAGTFAQFKNVCSDIDDRFQNYNDLCNEIWGQWLPNSEYVSLIELETLGCVEGYAALEIYHPTNPTIVPYQFEMLLPVKKNS